MNNYFKVETHLTEANSKHIRKDFYMFKNEALAEFNSSLNFASLRFYQGEVKAYTVTLAEVFPNEQRTVIHKIRKAPL